MGSGPTLATPSQPTLTQEQKQKIINALTEKGASLACPRCGNEQFTLLDRLTSLSLGDGKTITLGGQTVPAAVVICTKCGAINLHSMGALGLFEEFGFKSR